jgi:putative flippase GtrA
VSIRTTVLASANGILTTAVDVLTLTALVESGVPVSVSAAAGCMVGAVVNFLGNKYLAFGDRSPIAFAQVARFAMVAIGTALAMAVAMHLVAVTIGVPYLIAKAICAAAIFFAWSLPAQRAFVFPGSRGQRSEVSARPPSIDTRSPVIQPASSLTRKAASAATSSAVPGRPSGWVWRERSRNAA